MTVRDPAFPEETEFDRLARERRERQAHRPAPAPSAKDIEQDNHIRALEAQNKELRIYLAQLVRVLVDHDVVSKEDVKQLVANVTKVEQQMGLHLVAHDPKADSSRVA